MSQTVWTPTLKGGANLLFGQIMHENCMKMKEIGPGGGTSLVPHWIHQWLAQIKLHHSNLRSIEITNDINMNYGHLLMCDYLLMADESCLKILHSSNRCS